MSKFFKFSDFFRSYSLPAESDAFEFNFSIAKKMILRAMLKHVEKYEDYPYNIIVHVACQQGLFERIVSNMNLAMYDAWEQLMKTTSVNYSHEGPAHSKIVNTEDENIPYGQIIVKIDADCPPIYGAGHNNETSNDGTTDCRQDKSISLYYRSQRLPYAQRCTDRTLELFVKPFKIKTSGEITDGDIVLKLKIVGGSAETWINNDSKTYPIFRSQNHFVIGGKRAPVTSNLIRLDSDTAYNHLDCRKKRFGKNSGWEVRALEGEVYINGEPTEQGEWLPVEDGMMITIDGTTFCIEIMA